MIFLSVIDSKEEGEGPLGLRQDGQDGMWKKRYNVAASRAKDQLWVVYSLDYQTQLKPGDLRRRLIEQQLECVKQRAVALLHEWKNENALDELI